MNMLESILESINVENELLDQKEHLRLSKIIKKKCYRFKKGI